MSCIFHSDTVPHALPRFHNPFSSVLVQFEKATVQPRTLCRLCSSWTHQVLQWKCFCKLAQRNGWVLAISVGVLSLSPGSYILKRMVFITTSFGVGRFKAVFWWEICRVTTLWNAAGHDPKGHGYRRHRQERPPVSSDATAAAEEWCFFVQSSRNQKTDKWRLPLNHVEACSRILRSTSHAEDACSFTYRNGEIPFKIALVWTTSEETDAGQTWGWKQLRSRIFCQKPVLWAWEATVPCQALLENCRLKLHFMDPEICQFLHSL